MNNLTLRLGADGALDLLEPLQLHAHGRVERRDAPHVVVLEVLQVQRRGAHHREVGALREAGALVRRGRQQRQPERLGQEVDEQPPVGAPRVRRRELGDVGDLPRVDDHEVARVREGVAEAEHGVVVLRKRLRRGPRRRRGQERQQEQHRPSQEQPLTTPRHGWMHGRHARRDRGQNK
jgi:hypothetical protein